jgi:transcriptional antiterminator RfaH
LEEAGRSILDWIPGAIGIVNFGSEPASVPDHLIIMLKQHLDAINASDCEGPETFRAGDVVTINGRPLAGYEGIFDASLPGQDRVKVLLNMFQGSQIRVEVSREKIKLRKANSALGVKK